MAKSKKNNIAYIDGANLHKGIKTLPWDFDHAKFRVWLLEKYNVVEAYIFLGLVSSDKNMELYLRLESQGYILIFKEVVVNSNGRTKGNCDADLIVLLMQHLYGGLFDKAILISSDGDYIPLIKLLIHENKIEVLVSPYNRSLCSIILRRSNVRIVYIDDQKYLLKIENNNYLENKKAADEDGTS